MPDPALPQEPAQIRRLAFAPDGGVPNHPDLPVLVMAGALPAPVDPEAVRALVRANGWGGSWVGSVFDYHHFHPDAHEVLACLSGWADLILGGPSREMLRVEAGDVLVLPAGTGHCLAASGDGFRVCGAYPRGQEAFTTTRADCAAPPDDAALDRLRRVPPPRADPIFGAHGPLRAAWG